MSQLDQLVGKSFLRKKSFLGEKEKETLYAVQECTQEEWSGAKYLLLFFSAGWCPPCMQFQQTLKDFYNEVNIDGKVIEVLYISSDRGETQFKETYAKMPWLTFRYESPMHAQLKEKFSVQGVPVCLVFCAETGQLITSKGRKDICDLGVSCLNNWRDELPIMREKMAALAEGFAATEKIRL